MYATNKPLLVFALIRLVRNLLDRTKPVNLLLFGIADSSGSPDQVETPFRAEPIVLSFQARTKLFGTTGLLRHRSRWGRGQKDVPPTQAHGLTSEAQKPGCESFPTQKLAGWEVLAELQLSSVHHWIGGYMGTSWINLAGRDKKVPSSQMLHYCQGR